MSDYARKPGIATRYRIASIDRREILAAVEELAQKWRTDVDQRHQESSSWDPVAETLMRCRADLLAILAERAA